MLEDIARRLLSADARSSIRNYQRRLKCSLQFWKKPVSLAQMRCILTEELGLHLGERVLVTSVFEGLNAAFTLRDLCAFFNTEQ